MNSRAGYRLNAFAVWRKAVIQIFLEINFPSGGTAQSAACDGWEQSQESQLRAEEEREKTLRKALELLGDQSRFKDEIIKKPARKRRTCLMTSRRRWLSDTRRQGVWKRESVF
jgi:hypothetical protein